MIPTFDRFVGVDWSGATGRNYSGIAVADCRVGMGAPVLIEPPGKKWRRTDFVDWMAAQAGTGERLLVGIDCAFALPAPMAAALLGRDYSAAALWAYIDSHCAGAEDFFGGPFARHERHRPHFWHDGPRPTGFAELHRATEYACRAAGLGTPESPLKLVGARQVGKGGLAGMRVLHALKTRLNGRFVVWPFDPAEGADIVCIELYPRLFMKMAGHGNAKVRTVEALDRCLRALGCITPTSPPPAAGGGHLRNAFGDLRSRGRDMNVKTLPLDGGGLGGGECRDNRNHSQPPTDPAQTLTDHETDALVAAAGLRFIAGDPAIWAPKRLDALAKRAEGWIFGVV